ncbi:MAG: lipocalin family protein [Steroidobacteraceae bacterium]|jgi:apolipoprotein D and lipocalin family protein
MHRKTVWALGLLGFCLALAGCAVSPKKVTVPTVQQVDLAKFMGPWYVIATIPTFIETDAYNAVESYALNPDGTIHTTFTFNKGALDGPPKKYEPKGFVVPGTGNAIWGMRFVWPIKAEFVISHLDGAYSETIIARSARDYVWIMARTPSISAERYQALVQKVQSMGYDISRLRKVPHSTPPPAATPAPAAATDRTREILARVAPVTATTLRERIDTPAGRPVILDVRAPEEFAAGHLPGARNIPYDQIPNKINELKSMQHSEIVVYCRSGRRAAIAIETLLGAGFDQLRHLEGDFEGWRAAGQPVSATP